MSARVRAQFGIESIGLALVVASLSLGFGGPARAQSAASGRTRADGVAAIVGRIDDGSAHYILRSDVELRAVLRLGGQLRTRLPEGELPNSLLRAVRDELIGEALLAREAEFVQHASVDEAAVDTEVRRLEDIGGGSERVAALLRARGLAVADLRPMARRRALVQVFLRANLEGGLRVDDVRLAEIHASNEHPFIGQDLDEARDALRVWVRRDQVQRAVQEWVDTLRERTPVRILARYE